MHLVLEMLACSMSCNIQLLQGQLLHTQLSCIHTFSSSPASPLLLLLPLQQVNKALADGSLQLQDGDVVRLENYVCNKVGDDQLLMVSGLQLLQKSSGNAAANNKDAAGAKPDQQLPSTPLAAVVKQEVKQEPGVGQVTPPAARPVMTPGPTPSPSEE
jgi:hypothetical protein